MGRNDWFQNTTWTAAESEHFEEKLGRARRAKRPGYLRVQGTLLIESDDASLRETGRGLLSRAIRDGSHDDPLEAQWARMNLAKALAREGMLVEAERYYRECVRVQEEHSGHGVNTDCHIAALDKPQAPRHPGVGLARPTPEDRDEMERLAS